MRGNWIFHCHYAWVLICFMLMVMDNALMSYKRPLVIVPQRLSILLPLSVHNSAHIRLCLICLFWPVSKEFFGSDWVRAVRTAQMLLVHFSLERFLFDKKKVIKTCFSSDASLNSFRLLFFRKTSAFFESIQFVSLILLLMPLCSSICQNILLSLFFSSLLTF